MLNRGSLAFAALLFCVAALPAEDSFLRWQVTQVEVPFDEGRPEAELAFRLENGSAAEVTVTAARSSCGCTLLRTASFPWKIAAGSSVSFSARVDLRGRRGELHKTITLSTSRGEIAIPVTVKIPEPPMTDERKRNQLLALADAKAIFRDDCASCHVTPAVGKTGPELYVAACAICHEAKPRASAVPALPPGSLTTPVYWRRWIEHGKDGSLMPPFAKEHGGILTPEQVDSLIAFLSERP